MSNLAIIEGELLMARIRLRRAARAEEQHPVGSRAYMEIFEIIDELLAQIQGLELARHAILRTERHTVQ
jgi:hypothetical protein